MEDESGLTPFQQLFGSWLGYDESQVRQLMAVAKKCSLVGAATGGGWLIYGSPGGPVAAAAGFVAGFTTGTAACTAVSIKLLNEAEKHRIGLDILAGPRSSER